MVGDNKDNQVRHFSLSIVFFVFVLICSLGFAASFSYTHPDYNITVSSDKSSYSCYPGCTAYINVTSNNQTLNGTYNITFNNTGSFNTTNVNFTVYNCTSDLSSCTEASNLTNFNITNGTVYPFMVVINMSEALFGKWNFSIMMFNGTNYTNITFDPYIDSINLTYPANNTYTNDTTPLFNFTYTSAYNSSLNCTLFLNSTAYGEVNATNSTTAENNITANSTLGNAGYIWYMGCDSDGDNVSDEFSVSRIITVDNTTPSVTINSPRNSSPVYKKNISNLINFTLNFSYTELYPTLYRISVYNSTGDLSYNVTNSSNITAGSSTALQNISIPLLDDGSYDVRVEMYDKSGNMNYTRENQSLIVDSTNPQVSIYSPTTSVPFYRKNRSGYINFTLTLNHTESNPANYTIYLINSSGNTSYSVTNSSNITAGTNASSQNVSVLFSNISEGLYDIKVIIHDLLGNNNYTRENDSLYIDNTGPVITLNTSNNYWDEDGNSVAFNYTLTDISGYTNCSLWLTNSSGGSWSVNMTNVTGEITNGTTINTFTVNGLDNNTNHNGTYTWNVGCYDLANNTAFASSNRTLYVGNRPDLIVYDITLSPTAPYSGQNFTANVTIKNAGTYAVSNMTNVSFVYGSYTNRTVQISGLAAGASTSVLYYNITALSGNNSMTAAADYASSGNGNCSFERSESNNTRVEYLSTDLNITLMNVVTYGNIYPGETITVNISARFYNGTPITTLSSTDLKTFYDTYGGRSDWNRTDNTSSVLSGGTGGYYTINYTVPENSYAYLAFNSSLRRVAEAGNHTTKIFINTTYGDGYYSSWLNSTNSYSIMAPDLEVEFTGIDTTLTYPSANTDTGIYFKVRNTGTEDIENITANIQSSSSTGYKVDGYYNLWCYYNGTLANSSTTWSNLNCYGNTNFDAAAYAIGTYNLTVLSLYGTASVQGIKYNSTGIAYETITVTNSSSSTTTDNTDTTDTITTNDTDDCSTDSNCATNEYCLVGTCVLLSCESGYSAVDHECVLNTYSYNLKIMEVTESIELMQGENATIEFKIKNTGNVTSNVKINATNDLNGVDIPINTATYHILQPYMTYSSTLTVNVSNTSDIGIGNIVFTAYDKDRPSVKAEYNITLTIHPTEETKVLLNTTYDTYLKMLNDFNADFAAVDSNKVSSENYTKLNRSLTTISRMLEDIKSKMASDDYLGAERVLKDVDKMLSEIENQFGNLEEEKAFVTASAEGDMTFWMAGIIIVVIVGGVLVYLLLPPKKGYNVKTGYRSIGGPTMRKGKGAGMVDNIKSKLGSISSIKRPGLSSRNKASFGNQRTLAQFKKSYMPGYERQKSNIYSVHKDDNHLMKLKKLVKKS